MRSWREMGSGGERGAVGDTSLFPGVERSWSRVTVTLLAASTEAMKTQLPVNGIL